MYLAVLKRIDYWERKFDIPSDFLMEVAEKRKEEVIGWLKFEAKTFGYKYIEDGNYICDEVIEAVNEEAWRYIEFMQEEEQV